MLEAVACREGLALANDLLLQRVRMASDCNNVVRSFKEEAMGSYAHVIRDIRARQEELLFLELVHERRSSNVAAHRLARNSLYANLGRHVWFIEPPDGVCNKYSAMASS